MRTAETLRDLAEFFDEPAKRGVQPAGAVARAERPRDLRLQGPHVDAAPGAGPPAGHRITTTRASRPIDVPPSVTGTPYTVIGLPDAVCERSARAPPRST